MTGTEDLNENVPRSMSGASDSPHHNPSDPSTVQTVQQYQKQLQQQQRKSETAASDRNMDEHKEDKPRFQNERRSLDVSKQPHQSQAVLDTSQNGKRERGEIEIQQGQEHGVNTSRAPSREQDPKDEQKDAKHRGEDYAERQVTDPVTHLSVTIHDFTARELKHALENIPLVGNQQLPVDDVGGKPNSKVQSDKVTDSKNPHTGMEKSFPPSHECAKVELIRTFRFAVNVGMGIILLIITLLLFEKLFDVIDRKPWADAVFATITLEAVVLGFGVWGFRRWLENKVDDFWEDQVWEKERQSGREKTSAHIPESTEWLNSLLASVWPLVNPDLFASLADTLEDSMQANLPKLVKMINVEDLGQGNEALRILGVRWLPSDATSSSDSASSKVPGQGGAQENTESEDPNSQKQDQKHGQDTTNESREEQDKNLVKAVEAEEGESVSFEIAFAYRARPAGRELSSKAKNAHLFLAIYLPAGIRLPLVLYNAPKSSEDRSCLACIPSLVLHHLALAPALLLPIIASFSRKEYPVVLAFRFSSARVGFQQQMCGLGHIGNCKARVNMVSLLILAHRTMAFLYLVKFMLMIASLAIWVEVRGIVGTIRIRLQLTPDPPFFARCTFTFMGRPKAKLSCMPLFKHGLNIMTLPIISSFVQTSVNAAMAEYVAPKSLTLDLKDILMADDFKTDTNAHGVIVVRIKQAVCFKESDTSLFRLKKRSADPYVSVGWAKFGKSVWSTRVIVSEMEPIWDETGFIVVSSEEFNAQERLRVQLWDYDRSAADGDLGWIDIGLKEVMQNPRTNGAMLDRRDSLHTLRTNGDTPCTLDWSLGYFSKTGILPTQLVQQTNNQDIKSIDDLRKKVFEESARKLRESTKDESHEIEKQNVQDLKAREDKIIISSAPSADYPSGIFAIQIHQILGLGFRKIKRDQEDDNCDDDGQVKYDDLLSSYCTVILNHKRVFKTRTKPKSANPSFNAGSEQFIRDWRTTEVILSVYDLHMHEHDPLVGVVVLPLAEIFKQRSQINDYFSLSGGIGHGRVRISMMFRSIQLQAPRELRGWEYGTLKIASDIKSKDLSDHYKGLGLKLRTSVESDGMSEQLEGWSRYQGQSVELAVRQRYCSNLVIEFQESNPIHNHISAFSILWLKDIPDDEEKTVTLPVWKGNLKRAKANCEPEGGEKLGHIEVRLRFQPGISDHHRKLASKDRNLGDVMEVLEIVRQHKIKVSIEEAAFESHDGISNHEDSHERSWPQLASKEHGEKSHRITSKVKEWKSAHTTQ